MAAAPCRNVSSHPRAAKLIKWGQLPTRHTPHLFDRHPRAHAAAGGGLGPGLCQRTNTQARQQLHPVLQTAIWADDLPVIHLARRKGVDDAVQGWLGCRKAWSCVARDREASRQWRSTPAANAALDTAALVCRSSDRQPSDRAAPHVHPPAQPALSAAGWPLRPAASTPAATCQLPRGCWRAPPRRRPPPVVNKAIGE